MRALFEKDLRLILIRKTTILMFIVIGAIFTWSFSGTFSVAYITMLGALLALSTLSYDENDHCMAFILTLPCSRKDYVLEKYLFVFGVSLIAGLMGIAVIAVFCMVKAESLSGAILTEILASEIPILTVAGGLMIPLQIKFGPEKSRMVLIMLFGIVFILGFLAGNIPVFENHMESIKDFFLNVSGIGFLSILIVVMVILTLVSVFVSMKIIENKEY